MVVLVGRIITDLCKLVKIEPLEEPIKRTPLQDCRLALILHEVIELSIIEVVHY